MISASIPNPVPGSGHFKRALPGHFWQAPKALWPAKAATPPRPEPESALEGVGPAVPATWRYSSSLPGGVLRGFDLLLSLATEDADKAPHGVALPTRGFDDLSQGYALRPFHQRYDRRLLVAALLLRAFLRRGAPRSLCLFEILRHSNQESYRKEKENGRSGRDLGMWLPERRGFQLPLRQQRVDYNRMPRCEEIALTIRTSTGQLIASLTGLPTRLSISTSVSMVNLAVFLFTTSDTRGRETIKISAASACFK